MRRSGFIAIVALVAAVHACGGAPEELGLADAGASDSGAALAVQDAGVDAGEDAGTAASDDAGTDAGDDAGQDAGTDAGIDAGTDGGADAGTSNACSVFGAPGQCITVSACAALHDHTSYAGHCPGPADIECCIDTPDTSDNPPVPAGYQLMHQSAVTPEMTAWAVAILDDPATYPMFDTVLRTFGSLTVLARVEWHPPDFQNGVVHRGVTLYQPI